jgi:preprotein translocase subunit SecY
VVRLRRGHDWLKDIAATLSPGQPIYVMLYAARSCSSASSTRRWCSTRGDRGQPEEERGLRARDPSRATRRPLHRQDSDAADAGRAVYITAVCLLPEFLILKWNVPFYFGGTSC